MLNLCIAETQDFNEDVLNSLSSQFQLIPFNKDIPLRILLEQVDIFWFRLAYKIDDQVISSTTKCKYIVTPVTGIDHIDLELCTEYGIKVISLKGEVEFLKTVRATAEHTIGLTLSLLRHIVPAVLHTKEGSWNRDLFRGNELFQKKVGIIGMGRLGNIVADFFTAFGCQVSYFDPNTTNENFIKNDSLQSCLSSSDIISIHVNYDSTTHNLIGIKEFNQMKPNAILINTSRGGIVNDKALINALKNKTISGAALDVVYGEPENISEELLAYAANHHNLILTPHIGGNTFESFAKTEQFIAKKLVSSVYAN